MMDEQDGPPIADMRYELSPVLEVVRQRAVGEISQWCESARNLEGFSFPCAVFC